MGRLKYIMGFAFIMCITQGCDTQSENATCESLCDELVKTCEFEAFPSYSSCLDGCAYNEAEGADIEAELKCVENAVCDTFKIIECENQHGAQDDAN